MLLADLGAEVVKVERPGGGDETRSWGPPWSGGTSTYFLSVNRNKTSRAIDLGTAGRPRRGARARRRLRRGGAELPRRHDGEVRPRLRPARRAARPDLVYCSVTGFGPGAGADLAGYDLVVQAVGGLMSVTGSPEAGPTKVGVALVDVVTGLHAALGILAALRHRDRTGEGQHVEVNLLSSLLSALTNQASAYLATGEPPAADGQPAPEHRALRGAPLRRPADRRRRRERPAVRPAGRATWAVTTWPSTRGSPPTRDRVAHREELVAELEERAADGAGRRLVRPASARRACRADRSTTSARRSRWQSSSGWRRSVVDDPAAGAVGADGGQSRLAVGHAGDVPVRRPPLLGAPS